MKPPAVIQSFTRHTAQAVYRGEMDYFEAEYQISTLLPSVGFHDYDACFDLLAKFLDRYEHEALRLTRAIRTAVRPMFERRQTPDEIKNQAAQINKAGFLTAIEINQILQSEYNSWKSQQIMTRPHGNPSSMIGAQRASPSQSMRE